MPEIDEQALKADIAALGEAGEGQGAEQAAVEALEIPVGDQTYKIPLNAEVPIKHNGGLLKTPLEKILNTYRQGANYEDKFKELREARQKFEAERGDLTQFQELKNKYGAIQEWSEKNPDQWEKLWSLYQDRDRHLLGGQGQETPGANPELINELVGLKKQVSELAEHRQQFEKQQEEQQVQQDMKAIESEIEDIKKSYGDKVNLDEKDLDGLSLQSRIIQWGIDNAMPTFKAAFFAYPEMMTKLLDTAAQGGRNEAVKAVKKDRKEGVIERSSTPFGQGAEVDPTKMSPEDLQQAAISEFEQLMSKGE